MITADGCWADFRIDPTATRGRPALFLDRDGVLIEDTGYPHDADSVVLIPDALALVRAASLRNYVIGIVSNQSGVGRGLFGWPEFCAVQDVIDTAVRSVGGHLDFVLACPYHGEAKVARYRQSDHPWRKPAPGMILAAAERLGLTIEASAFVGDRASDMQAAQAAFIPFCLLVDGMVGGDPGYHAVARHRMTAAFEDWSDRLR